MIITVTLNPCIDKTLQIDNFQVDGVCRAKVLKVIAGGKGINVSRAVKELGEDTLSLGIIGGSAGQDIVDRLRDEGIKLDFINIQGESRTCYGIIDPLHKTETVINESGPHVSVGDIDRFKELFKKTVNKNDLIAISGSAMTGVKSNIYNELITIARKKDARVILDTSGSYLSEAIEAIPYAVKINKNELESIFNATLYKKESIMGKANILLEKGIYLIVVTQGEEEVIAITKESGWSFYPPEVVSVNSWGSGDCVVAGILTYITRGYSVEEALAYGFVAGAANTMSYGAGIFKKSVVNELYKKILVKQLWNC